MQEIGQKDDVAVRIAKQIVQRNLLSAVEYVVDAVRTQLIFFYVGLVTDSQFHRHPRGALIVAKQDNFHVGM
jgi:hypothetical protein